MKLFQIEEPDGSPVDPDLPGVAVGIDLGGAAAEVAVAVGGNAAMLADREEFPLDLSVPAPAATLEEWRDLLIGARLRAERALAQPVTHAVLALAAIPEPDFAARLQAAGEAAGLMVLRILATVRSDGSIANVGEPRALAAAIRAEDIAPRPAPPPTGRV